jgi:biotin carboxyl carrier protein
MKFVYSHANQTFAVNAERTPNGIEIQIDGERSPVHILAIEPPRITFLCGDVICTARVASNGKRRWVHWNGTTFVLERGEAATPRVSAPEREGTGSGLVTAPMPGQVRGVLVQRGDWVEEGQPLLLLEAMKMEIRVTATRAGQIVQLDARVGQSVEREQILGRIEEVDTQVRDEQVRDALGRDE